MLRITSLLAAVLIAAMMTGTAFAQNPHFVTAKASVDSSGNLIVAFKEAGLGNYPPGVQLPFQASADATAVWGCINHGGKHPQASNKETVSGPVQNGGSFGVSRNGSVTGSITISPPAPPTDLTAKCTGNQVVGLVSVSYTNVVIKDIGVTPNDVDEIPGTYSVVFYR